MTLQCLRPIGLVPRPPTKWIFSALSCSRVYSTDAAKQLPLDLPTYAVWGANTGVGKTLASVGLAHAAQRLGVSADCGRGLSYTPPHAHPKPCMGKEL